MRAEVFTTGTAGIAYRGAQEGVSWVARQSEMTVRPERAATFVTYADEAFTAMDDPDSESRRLTSKASSVLRTPQAPGCNTCV